MGFNVMSINLRLTKPATMARIMSLLAELDFNHLINFEIELIHKLGIKSYLSDAVIYDEEV